MAEFVEVVTQYNRMCSTYLKRDCSHCPMIEMVDDDFCCSDYMIEYPRNTENIVMQWAVENPEPIYPKWIEYIGGLYPMDAGQAIYEQIPEDIAKKLGIEPIGLRFEPIGGSKK